MSSSHIASPFRMRTSFQWHYSKLYTRRSALDPRCGSRCTSFSTSRSAGAADLVDNSQVRVENQPLGKQQHQIKSESLLHNVNPSPSILQRREAANRPDDAGVEQQLRLPRSVQAAYLRPLRRQAKYGIPTCDLQMRSFSVRNLEFFADFALRAAYYLNLAAHGPVPLPKKVERWTVPRSSFVYKKSQENFERITLRRLIQIRDGHPETIETWLAFLKKHAYYGVGMKANIWEFEKLGVGKTMDVSLENLKGVLDSRWAHFGRKKNTETSQKVVELMRGDKLGAVDDGPMRF